MQNKIISPLQCRDTCLALTLLLLIILGITDEIIFLYMAIVMLLLGMIFPNSMKPLAKLWYGLSEILGSVVSKIILILIFVLVVTPVALIRQLMGKDVMQLKQYKQCKVSYFVERNHSYTSKDLTKLY